MARVARRQGANYLRNFIAATYSAHVIAKYPVCAGRAQLRSRRQRDTFLLEGLGRGLSKMATPDTFGIHGPFSPFYRCFLDATETVASGRSGRGSGGGTR